MILESERIFFLGFGFAKENLQVLDLPRTLENASEIYATAFGLHEKGMEHIWETLQPTKSGPLIIEPVDCLELLRRFPLK